MLDDLDQLRRQAKELLHAFVAGDATAVAQVNAHLRDAEPSAFRLHDAQLALARSYGFESWPKLKAHVDRITVTRLADAVRAGDVARVRAMLDVRPELVRMHMANDDERRALHLAVLARLPEMVRLLMQHGADPRQGIYPHRDATGALTLAAERGYDEIADVIREEGRSPSRRSREAIDASGTAEADSDKIATARAAVAAGNRPAVSALHARGALPNRIRPEGGLLTVAVQNDRPEILALLLDLGLDPDERRQVDDLDEVVFSWGMPLWHCAGEGKYAMAELLLRHGADPNARVHASGSPVFQAYSRRDRAMAELLGCFGGTADATTAGLFGQTALARQMLAGEVDGRIADGAFAGRTVAEQLLWGAACGGAPAIVASALEGVDWPHDDPRWYPILEQPLRVWSHGTEPPDRSTYLACFGLILERCDPNVRGRFGLAILHDVAGSREHVTPDERVAFATMLLDAGARTDLRDELLRSTPLGWACRWGRGELVDLLLQRGADPLESDAEPWATPQAWATKMGHAAILERLLSRF